MKLGRLLVGAAVITLACGGPTANAPSAPPPRASGTCPDPAPLYALACAELGDDPALALPAVSFPGECDLACEHAGEARLGLEPGALARCGSDDDDPCNPSWRARLVHVQPIEAGRCAFGVVRAELGYSDAIGTDIEVATRFLSVEVDAEQPDRLRVREADLPRGHPERRSGPTFGDLDGDGRADWLDTWEEASDRCFASTYDTPECSGYGVPASTVVEARGERGRLTPAPLPVFGAVLTPALSAELERVVRELEACDETDPDVEECPEVEFDLRWRGRRPEGAPVARRIEGGFAIDQVVEEVDCDELCVTPLGDVCTERPDPDYGHSSSRCHSLGRVLETYTVRGTDVQRQTRPAPDGTVAHVRCSEASSGAHGDVCSMEAILHPLGDGDPTPHRASTGRPAAPWPIWSSEGGSLALPTGIFAIQVLRSAGGSAETWLVTITAETGELTL